MGYFDVSGIFRKTLDLTLAKPHFPAKCETRQET